MMWFALIAALLGMSALTIIQTPREWLKRPLPLALLILFHAAGIASILLILFAVYRMQDGPLRELIIWTETVYVTVTAFALLLSVVRYFGFELARHFRHRRVLRILSSSTAFLLAALLISAAYMVPSIHNAVTLRTVTYDVPVDKSCGTDALPGAVISDFPIGGGARRSELDQMAALLTAADPDVILIDGDVCDSSSSADDLAYMEEILRGLHCRYGVFYAEGNHEQECRFDPDPYLLRAGVSILRDEGVQLENGVNIVGRRNALVTGVPRIMADCGLDAAAPTVVLQHRAKGLSQLEGIADVVACGHTHGYQFPFLGILMPYQRDISYGHRMYGETHVIVSSGVAEWGYRTKWPSQSEVTLIRMSFKEAAA